MWLMGKWKTCKINVLNIILLQNKLDQRILGHCPLSDPDFQAGVWEASKWQKEDPLLQWNQCIHCLWHAACCTAGMLTELAHWKVTISVSITYQNRSAKIRVEPNSDFNIHSSRLSKSWQYILVLSFKVALHGPLSVLTPIVSTA